MATPRWVRACSYSATDQRLDVGRDVAQRVPQVHPQQGGDLVVAGPAGPQPTAQFGPDDLDQATFQGAVHVLVARRRAERPGGHRLVQLVQAGEQPGELVVGQQAGPVQGPGVGARTRPGRSAPAASRTGSTC